MQTSIPTPANTALSTLDDTTFLQRVALALPPDDFSDNRLDSPSSELTTEDLDIPSSAPLAAYPYFHTTHLALNYLLGNDTQFPASPNSSPAKLLTLYCSTTTYALIATALQIDQAAVTPRLAHDFFARMAWINEASIRTEAASKQLDQLLYGATPLSDEAARLGTGAFSELGELLTQVPESLRMWMLQFKRGQRWETFTEWMTSCPAERLLNGLMSVDPAADRSALTSLASTLEHLLPTAGDFHDDALARSQERQLALAATQQRIRAMVTAAQEPAWRAEGLGIEWDTILDPDTCFQFFHKLALYALNANQEAWLPLALDNARAAPGMQAFSMATTLTQKYPSLSANGCLRLGSLLLPDASVQALVPLEPLPDTRKPSTTLPAFRDWCPIASIDELFRRTGLELLCELKEGRQHLRLPAWQTWQTWQTWQAMMQSSHFATLFQPLLRKAGWYGALPGESASPRATQALAARAIIDHFLGPWAQSARSVARNFQDHWVTEFSHVQLRQEVRRDISDRNPDISPAALGLLEYLFYRDMAPELLIADTPDWLYYGRSLQSVALIHGARLLEALSPGTCSRARFDHVITLANDLSTTTDAQLRHQWSRTLILPALRYAKAHGALPGFTGSNIEQATLQQINQALDFFKSEQQSFASDASRLAMKAPDRRTLAEEQLKLAGVASEYWDKGIGTNETWRYLSGHGLVKSSRYIWDKSLSTPGVANDIGAPNEMPIVESLVQLVMTGDVYRDGDLTADQQYAHAFATFKANWQDTHARLIKRLFMELPAALRSQLYRSTCEVSLVRFTTQEGNNGLFIRCQPGDHRNDFDHHDAEQEHYFEIIPGAGALRPCPQQFKYSVTLDTGFNGNIVETVIQRDENESRKRRARLTPLRPLDSDAYLNGTPSRSGQQLQTPRQGTLLPASQLIYAHQQSEADFFQALASTAATHLYASTLEALKGAHTHTTPWEEIVAEQKRVADYIARAVLPFYGCIADLTEGDHSTGVIAGCVIDTVSALIPFGKFLAASATIVRNAGSMTLRATCDAMTSALGEMLTHLAQQSPALLYRDIGRGIRWLSAHAWEKLAQPAFHWLQDLRSASRFLSMTEDGAYCLSQQALSDTVHHYTQDNLAKVGSIENCLVRDLGTPENPRLKLLDPHSDLPYGPLLISEEAADAPSLIPLQDPGSIKPYQYPRRVACELTEDEQLRLPIDQACSVRIRYKGAGHYDIDIDEHAYRLDTTRHEPCLTRLSDSPVSELPALTSTEVICRPVRNLIEASACTAFTKLVSVPITDLPPIEANPRAFGREVSLAFENREFHLQRQIIPATGNTPGRTLNVLVHEGKFCKWDHEITPAKGRQPARQSLHKKIVALSEEERGSLALPDAPHYKPSIQGRMSNRRDFGLLPQTSGNQAKIINAHVPVVELDQVTDQVADKRILRGISHSLNGKKVVYIEVDSGKLYKSIQGPGELNFTPVTLDTEINEYLRLSEQYRFVAERPYSHVDRENIARLLYTVSVQNRTHGIGNWLTLSPTRPDYATYAQWCIDNKETNDLLHAAENILSAEDAQINLLKETKSIIPDWKPLAERQVSDQLHAVGILNKLLPCLGKEDSWVALSRANIGQPQTAELIAKQVAGGNLAYASIRTKAGKRFVYFALSGGKRTKGIRLKPYRSGETHYEVGEATYVDAGELMKNRSPDPSFTSLPVVRHAEKLFVQQFDRYLDSERLIATIIKEKHADEDLEYIKFFTRLDTCRSCGGVVLPQLRIIFPSANFSVTYLQNYPA